MFCMDEPLTFEKYPAKVILYATEQEYVPGHWHHNFELNYFVKGTWQVNIDDVNERISSPGIVPVNSQKVHWIRPLEAGTAAKIAIVFDTVFLEQYGFRLEDYQFVINEDIHPAEVLMELLQELYEFYESRLTDGRIDSANIEEAVYTLEEEYLYLYVNSLLYRITAELIRHYVLPVRRMDNKQARQRRKFRRACEYINLHYASDIALQDIADVMGVTKEHCARSFKGYMGMTCKEYLTGTRLVHAYNLIRYSDKTIAEISEMTGFPNPRSFNKSFLETYKILPKKMRKGNKNHKM